MKGKISHIILFISAAVFGWSCGNDMYDDIGPILNHDGIISFDLYLPDAITAKTKSVEENIENRIVNMTVLIFDGLKLAQTATIGSSSADFATLNSGGRQTLEITLNEELQNRQDLHFYFIANYSSDEYQSISKITDSSSLVELRTTRIPDGTEANPVPFCAEASLADLSASSVTLHRTVAKITVTDMAEFIGNEPMPGNINYSFLISNINENCLLFAGITNKFPSSKISGNQIEPEIHNPLYIFATPADNCPAVIVKTPFNGVTENYYRIELKSGNRYIDILPDHYYHVIIKSIKAPGFSSLEEALKKPEDRLTSSSIETVLLDNAPEVRSIISDGTRSLGTPHDIVCSSGSSQNNSETKLTVTYYSQTASDLDTTPTINSNCDWIKIGDATVTELSTAGRLATFPLIFHNDGESGEHIGSISISWQGLEKSIPVIWNSNFSLNSICSSVLTINRPGKSALTISDYGTFIRGEGSTVKDEGTAPVLYGIKPENMGGRIRNEGFHFPVMYGTPGEEWSYSYEIKMTGLKEFDDAEWSVCLDPAGDEVINRHVTISTSSGAHVKGADDIVFRLSRPGNCSQSADGKDYDYGRGKLIFEIRNASSSRRFTFGLYHTGFFHYDSADPQYMTKSSHSHAAGYYYYEVLPVVVDNGILHILDRNLGASASGQYIENQRCDDIFGSSEEWPYSFGNRSAGDLFSVPSSSEGFPADVSAITPPGYTIPSREEWCEIFASSGCRSESFYVHNETYHSILYESAVYGMGKHETVDVYFPKIHYYEGVNIMGWRDSGYYWTSTEPGGISDVSQYGKWLEYMRFSDIFPSFTIGKVSSLYLSVRCIGAR